MRYFFLLVATLCFVNHADASPDNPVKNLIKIPVLIAEDVKIHLDRITKQTDILTLHNFSNLPQGRDLVDVIILNQALTIGGCNCELEYYSNSVYGRNIDLLKSGKFAISADTLWRQDITKQSNDLVASKAVIEKGEYDVGLYTAKTNNKALSAKNLAQVGHLTAVSNRFWTADWQALQQLNPMKKAHIESFPNMQRLVKSEIADYTLMHFRIKNNTLNHQDLTPIPNIKAILWDSRHYAVSKRSPYKEIIINALDKGLSELSNTNQLQKAYQSVGINHPLTRRWKILNAVNPSLPQ